MKTGDWKATMIDRANVAPQITITVAKWSLVAWAAWVACLVVYWRQPGVAFMAATFWAGMEFEYLSGARIVPTLLGWRKK